MQKKARDVAAEIEAALRIPVSRTGAACAGLIRRGGVERCPDIEPRRHRRLRHSHRKAAASAHLLGDAGLPLDLSLSQRAWPEKDSAPLYFGLAK